MDIHGNAWLRQEKTLLVMSRQFIKYGIVGGLGTTSHYLILVLGVEYLAIAPIISTSFGFLVGAIVNYVLNYKFTFNSKVSHQKAMLRFFTIASIGFVINIVLFDALANSMSINYVASQFFCTLLIMTGTFALNRTYTF